MMRWPFERKTSPPESFAVGPYKLDGSIEGLGGLIEFSPSEYAALGRQFVGEKDYDSLPVDFLGHSWEVMVQAVHGRICAIAPYLLIKSREEAHRTAKQTFQHCVDALGKPAEREAESFLWRTSDGTVMLKTDTTPDGFRIGLVLTSSAVHHLQRV
jgi:hypothetical protein